MSGETRFRVMSSLIKRSHRFYAYSIITIAMTTIFATLIYVDQPPIYCFPPRGPRENMTLGIIGGEHAKSRDYPYLVSLQYYAQHFCGGSLISKRHVLTAAHCLKDYEANEIEAVVGANEPSGGIRYQIDQMTLHPDFRYRNMKADVGVIRLESEIHKSPNVKPIKLPVRGQKKFDIYHGREFDVCGFGATKTMEPVSDYLKKLTTYACSYEICEFWYGNVRSMGQFCAVLAYGSGACFGDSGSPITINKEFVIGIVIGGSFICGIGVPDVYTYVPDYLDFIESEMRK